MDNDKKKRKRMWRRILGKNKPETPKSSESISKGSLAASSTDGSVVLPNRPNIAAVHHLNGNRDSTSTAPGESKADQDSSSRHSQAPQNSETSSMAGSCKEELRQPLQKQGEQASPQLGVESLWKEAAEGLEPGDREKLDSLIKSKREDMAACSSPNEQGEGLFADDVSLILSRAKRLKEDDEKATWRHVSSITSQKLSELHAQFPI
jgi:hypothetical protein